MVVKTETENIIELEGINKSYQQQNGQQITIIENISLTLRSGEMFFLIAIESFTRLR